MTCIMVIYVLRDGLLGLLYASPKSPLTICQMLPLNSNIFTYRQYLAENLIILTPFV